MAVRGESVRSERGDAAGLSYRVFAAILVSTNGAALYLFGGVRDPASWAAFAFVALLALFLPDRWLTAKPTEPSERAASDSPRPRASGDSRDEEDDAVHAASPSTPPNGDDEVDHLRALRHELRTPLNAVLGFSDVLLSGIDGEINSSQREDLEIIRASGIRLRVLLDSALDISQLVQGELRLDVDRVELGELVTRVAMEAGQLWSKKRAAASVVPEKPCELEADESRLRRSVLVLADFLATMHRDASIRLTATTASDHVVIEIAAEPSDAQVLEALPTIAEVLAAEDVTKIRQWPVAVTAELVAGHGGSLYHGSAPSRFVLRLPLWGSR